MGLSVECSGVFRCHAPVFGKIQRYFICKLLEWIWEL